jgi:hypothetical protein
MTTITETTRDTAIREWAEDQIAHELKVHEKNNSERLAKHLAEQPELVQKWKDGIHQRATEVADEILDKDKCCQKLLRGFLNPSNTRTRRMFTALTGIALPRGDRATDEVVISEYIGRDRMDSLLAEKKAEKDADEKQRADKQTAIDEANLSRIKKSVDSNTGIDGDDLLTLARSLGIDAHPRTAGMLRKRVRSIRDGTASIGKGGSVQSAFVLYTKCVERMKLPDGVEVVESHGEDE